MVEVGDADITAVEVNRHQPPKFATGHQWRGRKKPPTPAQIIFGHLERSGYPQPEHAAAALHAPRSLDGWKLIETDDPDGDLGRPVAVVDAGGVVDALTLAAHHTPAQGQGWRLVDANGYTAMSTGPDGAVRLHQTRTTTTPPQRTAAQPLLVKCPECGLEGPAGMPSHRGSTGCQSGSIASGAPQQKAHCSCDLCY
ncbi:MAG TPA: hypothetical protein VHD87_15285 [Acidimicrobiales bacterium]|nr:hypothetical protein [Acidimicrobiales bacterium]